VLRAPRIDRTIPDPAQWPAALVHRLHLLVNDDKFLYQRIDQFAQVMVLDPFAVGFNAKNPAVSDEGEAEACELEREGAGLQRA
jgi:hypothetical protein